MTTRAQRGAQAWAEREALRRLSQESGLGPDAIWRHLNWMLAVSNVGIWLALVLERGWL